jgi:hypothetical protein
LSLKGLVEKLELFEQGGLKTTKIRTETAETFFASPTFTKQNKMIK